MRKQLLQHINQSIMDLLRIKLKKLVHVELLEALDEMLRCLGILLQDEGEVVHHLPHKAWSIKGIEEA